MKNHRAILVIDGQGGGCGKAIIKRLREHFNEAYIIACGSNVMATEAMLKAGANTGATGENAICYNAERAELILGPIGIVIPNSMLGEFTPKMAEAIASSHADKVLLPMQKCGIYLAIDDEVGLSKSINNMITRVENYIKNK